MVKVFLACATERAYFVSTNAFALRSLRSPSDAYEMEEEASFIYSTLQNLGHGKGEVLGVCRIQAFDRKLCVARVENMITKAASDRDSFSGKLSDGIEPIVASSSQT